MYPFNKNKLPNQPPLLSWDLFANELANDPGFINFPVGGYLKHSLIDYPGHISAMVFLQGCNFKCFYCHNPELVKISNQTDNTVWKDFYGWVRKNAGLLDAVVFSGGEPTIHKDLPKAIRKVKDLGLKAKLDTNGTNPNMLSMLLKEGVLDYVAMDIKHKPELSSYREIVGNRFTQKSLDNVIQSKMLLEASGIEHEFRMTVMKPYHTAENVLETCSKLKGKFFLQAFRDDKTLDAEKSISCENFSELELTGIIERVDEHVKVVTR